MPSLARKVLEPNSSYEEEDLWSLVRRGQDVSDRQSCAEELFFLVIINTLSYMTAS